MEHSYQTRTGYWKGGTVSLNDDDTLDIDNKSCVRCMHCINVMTKALSPGKERGVTVPMGGKRSLKIGDQMGTVIVPFLPLDTDEDFQKLQDLAETVIDFFAEQPPGDAK